MIWAKILGIFVDPIRYDRTTGHGARHKIPIKIRMIYWGEFCPEK
jgi:hypothetical protein